MLHFVAIGYGLAVLGLICFVFSIANSFSSRLGQRRPPTEIRKLS
jgi:hypothetical protein